MDFATIMAGMQGIGNLMGQGANLAQTGVDMHRYYQRQRDPMGNYLRELDAQRMAAGNPYGDPFRTYGGNPIGDVLMQMYAQPANQYIGGLNDLNAELAALSNRGRPGGRSGGDRQAQQYEQVQVPTPDASVLPKPQDPGDFPRVPQDNLSSFFQAIMDQRQNQQQPQPQAAPPQGQGQQPNYSGFRGGQNYGGYNPNQPGARY